MDLTTMLNGDRYMPEGLYDLAISLLESSNDALKSGEIAYAKNRENLAIAVGDLAYKYIQNKDIKSRIEYTLNSDNLTAEECLWTIIHLTLDEDFTSFKLGNGEILNINTDFLWEVISSNYLFSRILRMIRESKTHIAAINYSEELAYFIFHTIWDVLLLHAISMHPDKKKEVEDISASLESFILAYEKKHGIYISRS